MSDTPRTDAAYDAWYSGNQDWSAFARQLERELAAVNALEHVKLYMAKCKEFDDLALRFSKAAPSWVLCAEQMPEANRAVLAFWGKDRVQGIEAGPRAYGVAVWSSGMWMGVDDPEDEYGPATHWMPLPEAPK